MSEEDDKNEAEKSENIKQKKKALNTTKQKFYINKRKDYRRIEYKHIVDEKTIDFSKTKLHLNFITHERKI